MATLQQKTAKKLAACGAVGAYRQLLKYRGSSSRFTVEQTVGHELSHLEKERSAMLLTPELTLPRMSGAGELPPHYSSWEGEWGLLYPTANITKAYPGQGDVWTVRSKQHPNLVVRTRAGSGAYYDECIVTGRPVALVLTIRGDRNAAGAVIAKAKWLAARFQLQLILQ